MKFAKKWNYEYANIEDRNEKIRDKNLQLKYKNMKLFDRECFLAEKYNLSIPVIHSILIKPKKIKPLPS